MNPKNEAASEKNNSCFEKYQTQLDELLTKAAISKHYPVDFGIAEMEYDTAFGSPEYQQMVYSWPSNRTRTMEIAGREMTIPMGNKIGVGYVRFFSEDEKFPVKRFKSMYNFTQAEKEKAQKAIGEELDKKQDISEKTKTQAKKLTGTLSKKIKFTPVDGVGDAAVWDHLEKGLIVLKGHARFTVLVNISKDQEKNIALAKELAGSILEKCE